MDIVPRQYQLWCNSTSGDKGPLSSSLWLNSWMALKCSSALWKGYCPRVGSSLLLIENCRWELRCQALTLCQLAWPLKLFKCFQCIRSAYSRSVVSLNMGIRSKSGAPNQNLTSVLKLMSFIFVRLEFSISPFHKMSLLCSSSLLVIKDFLVSGLPFLLLKAVGVFQLKMSWEKILVEP